MAEENYKTALMGRKIRWYIANRERYVGEITDVRTHTNRVEIHTDILEYNYKYNDDDYVMFFLFTKQAELLIEGGKCVDKDCAYKLVTPREERLKAILMGYAKGKIDAQDIFGQSISDVEEIEEEGDFRIWFSDNSLFINLNSINISSFPQSISETLIREGFYKLPSNENVVFATTEQQTILEGIKKALENKYLAMSDRIGTGRCIRFITRVEMNAEDDITIDTDNGYWFVIPQYMAEELVTKGKTEYCNTMYTILNSKDASGANWEQRTWEIAKQFFKTFYAVENTNLHIDEDVAIEITKKFVEAYRKTMEDMV